MTAGPDTLRHFEAEFEAEGKSCTQPSWHYPAHISVWWAPGHFSGFRCRRRHRRNLGHRLDALTEELARLPDEIEALPDDCETESRGRATRRRGAG